MTDIAKRNLVAQWAFDTRPVLLRFHLWLEDVEVERSQAEPVSAHSFAPRGIARCLAMTSAATALGTRLFGDYGGAAAKDKATVNQVKKAADAVSAYVMSEGLWHLTRTLPENHALMVCLGEGLMPKVGETPEMGANPMLGFGRVYARPELAKTVESTSVLLDYRTPRKQVTEAIEAAYPGIRREHIHVWTLRGKSRVHRLGRLWEEWEKAGVHLIEDGWKAPSGLAVFTDSGTYAPTFLVGSWRDEAQALHVFLCDGYAATAEAMQAASLSDVLDVRSTMSLFSPTFELPVDVESRLMQLDPSAPDFAARLKTLIGGRDIDAGTVRAYADAIHEAPVSNMPLGKPVLRADDFLPEKSWSVLACVGYMCEDPYTGASGITQVGDRTYRVSTLLATRKASSRGTFTLRLMESFEETRQVFSPLLVRFLSGVDHTMRPVKISDSGRIRNELQTMIPQALEHDGDRIRVRFERINEMVLPRDKQARIREVLQWYKANHPIWFEWLEPV